MCSLLSQLRPAPSERYERRCGKRQYMPNYNLCRHIDLPSLNEMKDPLPPPLKTDYPDPDGHRVYRTSHGFLTPNLKEQFARHHQWKTTSEDAYVNHFPKLKPGVEPAYNPRADMTKGLYPGCLDDKGPYEYQGFYAKRGYLHENKVWPSMDEEYKRFPNNGMPRVDLFRQVRNDPTGRSEEETERVRDHIRNLVKNNALNIQFVKPPDHYTGRQEEVRLYEKLEKDPGRNPKWATSEAMAQFGRHIPAEEYKKPQFGGERVLSTSVVLQHPYNYFNVKAEFPDSLDYLPMPFNFTKKPTDLRLISGYYL